jgi:N-acetylneuraminic acid mutarotase
MALRRFSVVALIAAVVVLAGIGVGVYALAHGFGPSVGSWTERQVTGDLPLEMNFCAAYDPRVGKQIRDFGGVVSGTAPSTWAFDPATASWSRLPSSSTLPTSGEVGLVYDETSATIIRLGYVDFVTACDTWAYDASTNTWTKLRTTGLPIPSGGQMFGGGAMAYDPPSGNVILLARTGVETSTWSYDSRTNAWAELTTKGSPPARRQTALAYDKSMGRLLLFGGFGHFEKADGDLLCDTWTFDSATATWTELKPTNSPSARSGAAMAYDDASGRMILSGGYPSADTWTYDAAKNTWTKLRTAGSPVPREGASMFYDAVSRRLIMTGGQGEDPFVPILTDCWAFSY